MATTGKTNPLLRLRKRLRMNQADFWPRIGVTQSGGSRYENGRPVPKPVRILLNLAYSDNPNVAGKALARLRAR